MLRHKDIASGGPTDFLAQLGLMLPVTIDDVKQAYLAKVKAAHPDGGGTVKRFKQLQRAYERALWYAERHNLAWIGATVETYVAQQRVIDKVKGLDGDVDIEKVEWVKYELGEDFAILLEKVVGIELHGPQIDDQVVSWLAKEGKVLGGLRRLNLTGTQITYRGLKLLRRLPKLDRLGIHDSHLSWWQRIKIKWSFPRLKVVT